MLIWSVAAALLAVAMTPLVRVFLLPNELLIVHAMPDVADSGPVMSRLARLRISLWSECPVGLHAPNSVIGAAIVGYEGSSARQKQVIQNLVATLIDKGCSVDQHGEDGFTALMGAVLEGSPELVSLLLSRGADPLRRVQAPRPGAAYFSERRKAALGMNVLEFAQWQRPTGNERRAKMAAIIGQLAHSIQNGAPRDGSGGLP